MRFLFCSLTSHVQPFWAVDLRCSRFFKGQALLTVNEKENVFAETFVGIPATPSVGGLYPLRTSLNGHLWATLLPQKLPLSAIANKSSRKSMALVLIPHCGGRNRKRKTRVEHSQGPVCDGCWARDPRKTATTSAGRR